MKQKIEEYIDSHREEMVEQWRQLVNLEGKSEETVYLDAVAQHLCRLFTEAGVVCELRRGHPEAPQVLCGVFGGDLPGEPVLFSGHYDTVFKKGTFGDAPFSIDKEGKAHGPGCLDMKGGIIITLYVIKALKAAGYAQRPIRIVFCGDEESGPHHAEAAPIMREMAQGCKCSFNMETGPISGALCVGRKGAMIGSFVVNGVSVHSGNNFEAGRNAVVEAAHKMLAIDALTDMEKGTHMNVAVVKGGTLWNAVPDRCEVGYSGRFATMGEMARVREAIARLMKKTFVEGTTTDCQPGQESDGVFEQTGANLALWRFCSSVSSENGWGEMGSVVLGGGSDAITTSKVTPTLCSCGVVGEWNHTDREYALVETLFARAKLWCMVVQRLDEFSPNM